ncbi:MAG: diphthine--ammonia ligase [Firmicutes bacterium]|nr:diphthine--ammonia ligase [Bacillota bacterium]
MTAIYLSWSGGKDSALALFHLRQSSRWRVAGLLTTVSETYRRTSIHGVRRALLHRQAASLGLDVVEVPLPVPCTDEQYAARMANILEDAKSRGIQAVAFGDIFLEDVRAYREARMQEAGMEAVFPLWGRDSRDVAEEIIGLGFSARLVAIDTEQLDSRFLGRNYDRALLDGLPAGIDPCGERGEFHTFVSDGPGFRFPVACAMGPVERRGRFWFQDLLPADPG